MPPKRGRLENTEAADIVNAVSKGLKTPYGLTVSPNGWILPNRVRFGPWVDTTFKYKKVRYPKCLECEEGEACMKVSTMSLFPHQDFIKDYIQFASPYRGLLVFHGLGSGKTCSSIAAAEILLNNVEVLVMTPASLRDNYKNEIKKCGCNFFNTKQHWAFYDKPSTIAKVCELLKISTEMAKKNKGVWVPHPDKEPNFGKLTEDQRSQIDAQTNDVVENRYTFINYNGLQRKTIEKMTEGGRNPFDGKAVVVDEIHNLVSRIVNGRKIGGALYKLLMSAKNCKLILLSGTPIINYPFEVAYILNLVTGPVRYYELKANKASDFNRTAIETVLLESPFIDDFTIDISQRKVTLQLLPLGFKYTDRQLSKISRYEGDIIPHETIIADNINGLKMKINHDFSKRYASKETTLFPERREDFDMLFVNEEMGTIRNPKLFMKRALGTVSYYNTFSPELFPSWTTVDVPVPMNTPQFNLYEKARAEERKKEGPSKFKKGKKDDLFSASGQVYRFFSRAVCNFVFPDGIKRPFPSKLSDMKKEIDDHEDIMNIIDKEDEEPSGKGGNKKQEEYMRQLEESLKSMRDNMKEYLHIDQVGQYSPKFEKILRNIQDSPGNVLVYSQFRKVEGLGLLGMSLEANGWTEFKVKKVGNDWILDISDEDLKKPSYAAFTGNNEESRILLKIFNNDLESVPEAIRVKLGANAHNLNGGIIKAFMITQSGAEGISLKNTRQVHIMEPYWNHIRIDQVIGRAVRTCSHVALPPEDRNVKVFIYYSVLTEEQKAASFTIRTLDKSVTSDEYLYIVAKKKKAITDGLLELVQRSSVDCTLNAKHHGLRCFSFPVNMSDTSTTRQLDIFLEEQDKSLLKGLENKEWQGQLLRTKKGNFVVRNGTSDVYDYDIYLESGKVVKIGTITSEGNKRVIKFVD